MFQFLLAAAAVFSTSLAAPADMIERRKAAGGPASAQVTVYSGPSYTCSDASTVSVLLFYFTGPLTDLPSKKPSGASAGTSKVYTVTEGGCVIANIPFGGAVSASLTATPKAGAPGCYLQMFQQQGCGVTLTNQYHGFPFDGTSIGNSVGCAQPPVQSYGAFTITCG